MTTYTTVKVFVYTDLEPGEPARLIEIKDVEPEATLMRDESVRLPVFDIYPQPHPTLGHTFSLPPALRAWLESTQPGNE